MLHSVNLPLCESVLAEYGGPEELRRELETLGLDGVEGIWGGEDIPSGFPRALLTGYHLTFFPDWLDFYRGDRAALERKYGSLDALLATVQMPSGIPVATVAINGAKNAAVLAAQILAVSDDALAAKLDQARIDMAEQIAAKEAKLQAELA